MKKAFLSALLFLIGFLAAYLALCFLIPGLRIKLAAPPMEYFAASVTHMVFFKSLLALPAAGIAAALPWFIHRVLHMKSPSDTKKG